MAGPAVKINQLFINNEFVDAVSKKTFKTFNPATKEFIADIAEGDAADVDIAVKAARDAFKVNSRWRSMDAVDRGDLLYKLALKIEEHKDYFKQLETLDVGKPLYEAEGDIDWTIKTFKYFAGWADKYHGKTIPIAGNYMAYTRHEPVGVVAEITPWNFPMLQLAPKVAAALALGNCVILKPAEDTPLTSLFFASLVKEVGFPTGVFQCISGYGHTAGAALSEHPGVDKVAFTGSTAVGKMIQAAAAKVNVKRCSLELGGKSPILVFADADLDLAAETCTAGVFINSGQSCDACSRVFVHASVYDEFVKKAVAIAKARRVGLPTDPDTEQGAIINQRQYDRILKMIQTGVDEGAKLECGGKPAPGLPGYFIEPTVFSGVTDDMTVAREEIFGPVMQILKFEDFDDVIERANSSEYGLASGVFTRCMDTAHKVIQSIRAGNVQVNTYGVLEPCIPFGGYKNSGYGKDFSEYSLQLYTEVKTVLFSMPSKNS